jgi:hypothetical protein
MDRRDLGEADDMQRSPPRPRRKRPPRPQLERANGAETDRIFNYLLLTLVSRIDLERRRVFGDIDLSGIADMVGIAGVEAAMRDPAFRTRYGNFRTIIGIDGQRASNALSIAGATGIPRETVRRKLKVLVKRGFLIEKQPGRFIVKPGVVQKPEHLAALDRCMREAMLFMNQCLALGLVRPVNRPSAE